MASIYVTSPKSKKGGVGMESSTTGGELRRFDASQGPRNLGPEDGKAVDLGSVGVRFMAWTEETGGGFSLVEHPIPPRTLVAPLHRHSREDEYSFVLEGRMGALLGDDVIYAEVGDLAFKPRDQWHTFWNPDDAPCRILEIISPGGFEHYFEELAAIMSPSAPDLEKVAELGARYGLEFEPESVPRLCEEHGLDHPLLHIG
jgi:mannose-6-phosphate isomerase-like protein (cupin superfamily)